MARVARSSDPSYMTDCPRSTRLYARARPTSRASVRPVRRSKAATSRMCLDPYGQFERANGRPGTGNAAVRLDVRRKLSDTPCIRADGLGERVAGNAARRRSRLHLRKRKRPPRWRVPAAPSTSTSASATPSPAGRDLQVREDHDPQVPEVGPDGRGDDQPAGNGRSGSLSTRRQTAGVRPARRASTTRKVPPAQLWRAERRRRQAPARSACCQGDRKGPAPAPPP